MSKTKNKILILTKNLINRSRGSILAYSLIIISIMIFIAASISVVSVVEKKGASSTTFSAQDYQTADTGIQLAVKKINSHLLSDIDTAFGTGSCTIVGGVAEVTDTDAGLNSASPYTLTFFSDTAGTVPIDHCTAIVGTDIKSIKSIGTYKNTARAVQVAVASGTATVQGEQKVIANQCDKFVTGTSPANILCENKPFYKDITFSPSFTSVPKVIVSAAYISSDPGDCIAGATDQVIAYADNIAKTGFRMYCSGSPAGSNCGANSGMSSAGACSWMAVGL